MVNTTKKTLLPQVKNVPTSGSYVRTPKSKKSTPKSAPPEVCDPLDEKVPKKSIMMQ